MFIMFYKVEFDKKLCKYTQIAEVRLEKLLVDCNIPIPKHHF